MTHPSATAEALNNMSDINIAYRKAQFAAMTHKEAQQAILAAGDTVNLLVQRHAPAPSHAPAPGAWAPKLEADRAGMASNAEDFTREFMKQLAGGQ